MILRMLRTAVSTAALAFASSWFAPCAEGQEWLSFEPPSIPQFEEATISDQDDAPRYSTSLEPTPPPLDPEMLSEPCYVVLFAFQDMAVNLPRNSHTFAVFIRLTEDETGVQRRETHHISWLPVSRLVRVWRSTEEGENVSLEETLKLGSGPGLRMFQWGPYQIQPAFYAAAASHAVKLESGELDARYKCFDAWRRPGEINCIHAVADAAPHAPQKCTGFARGVSATEIVLERFQPHIVSYEAPDDVTAHLGLDCYSITRRSPPPQASSPAPSRLSSRASVSASAASHRRLGHSSR